MAAEVTKDLRSPEETLSVARALGESLDKPVVIGLSGEMGSGKTTFVRGLARGLDVVDTVSSPTYALMQRYRGRLELDHYDAWMEGREREVLADGAHELLGLVGVSVIEWADRVSEWLPDGRLELKLSVTSLEGRRLQARWVGEESSGDARRWLGAIQGWGVPEGEAER